jgi:hypothetical protein
MTPKFTITCCSCGRSSVIHDAPYSSVDVIGSIEYIRDYDSVEFECECGEKVCI